MWCCWGCFFWFSSCSSLSDPGPPEGAGPSSRESWQGPAPSGRKGSFLGSCPKVLIQSQWGLQGPGPEPLSLGLSQVRLGGGGGRGISDTLLRISTLMSQTVCSCAFYTCQFGNKIPAFFFFFIHICILLRVVLWLVERDSRGKPPACTHRGARACPCVCTHACAPTCLSGISVVRIWCGKDHSHLFLGFTTDNIEPFQP